MKKLYFTLDFLTILCHFTDHQHYSQKKKMYSQNKQDLSNKSHIYNSLLLKKHELALLFEANTQKVSKSLHSDFNKLSTHFDNAKYQNYNFELIPEYSKTNIYTPEEHKMEIVDDYVQDLNENEIEIFGKDSNKIMKQLAKAETRKKLILEEDDYEQNFFPELQTKVNHFCSFKHFRAEKSYTLYDNVFFKFNA